MAHERQGVLVPLLSICFPMMQGIATENVPVAIPFYRLVEVPHLILIYLRRILSLLGNSV